MKCHSILFFADDPDWTNSTRSGLGSSSSEDDDSLGGSTNGTWWDSYAECPLMDMSIGRNRLRLVTEILILIGSLLYLIAALREARFLGYKMFVENLVSGSPHVYSQTPPAEPNEAHSLLFPLTPVPSSHVYVSILPTSLDV